VKTESCSAPLSEPGSVETPTKKRPPRDETPFTPTFERFAQTLGRASRLLRAVARSSGPCGFPGSARATSEGASTSHSHPTESRLATTSSSSAIERQTRAVSAPTSLRLGSPPQTPMVARRYRRIVEEHGRRASSTAPPTPGCRFRASSCSRCPGRRRTCCSNRLSWPSGGSGCNHGLP